jgi:hypothetical protein
MHFGSGSANAKSSVRIGGSGSTTLLKILPYFSASFWSRFGPKPWLRRLYQNVTELADFVSYGGSLSVLKTLCSLPAWAGEITRPRSQITSWFDILY